MSTFSLYPGCLMPTEQYAYELSLREVLSHLGVELIDLQNVSCCGEPMKSVNQFLTLYLSARNIAIAEKEGHDLLVPCPMCHFALSETKHMLSKDRELRVKVNQKLEAESLTYSGDIEILHTVDLLHDRIGLDRIREAVKKPLEGLKLAPHYGCHLHRPSDIGRPTDAENPQKMDAIIHALGATTKYYPEKLDCCGALLTANHPDTALAKAGQKLQAVQEQGFDGLIDVCPWCQKMFDSRQEKAGEVVATKLKVPSLYLTQLMGEAFGIERKRLGWHLNRSPVNDLGNKKGGGEE